MSRREVTFADFSAVRMLNALLSLPVLVAVATVAGEEFRGLETARRSLS
jgi:hypothetical protein